MEGIFLSHWVWVPLTALSVMLVIGGLVGVGMVLGYAAVLPYRQWRRRTGRTRLARPAPNRRNGVSWPRLAE